MSTSAGEGRRKKKQIENIAAALTWQEKKELAHKEDDALAKEINDIRKWADMVDQMNDSQLKEYLKSRPEELKTLKKQKRKQPANRQKVQQVRKIKTSNSTGIMASVWKFHREDHEDDSSSIRIDV